MSFVYPSPRSDVTRFAGVAALASPGTAVFISHLGERQGHVRGSRSRISCQGHVHRGFLAAVLGRRGAAAAEAAEFTERVAELATHGTVDEEVERITQQDEEIQQQRRHQCRLGADDPKFPGVVDRPGCRFVFSVRRLSAGSTEKRPNFVDYDVEVELPLTKWAGRRSQVEGASGMSKVEDPRWKDSGGRFHMEGCRWKVPGTRSPGGRSRSHMEGSRRWSQVGGSR